MATLTPPAKCGDVVRFGYGEPLECQLPFGHTGMHKQDQGGTSPAMWTNLDEPAITAPRTGGVVSPGITLELSDYIQPANTVGTRLVAAADGTLVTPDHLCPDMLRWSNIGPADGPRGRVVRAFFWLMRAWPPPGRP